MRGANASPAPPHQALTSPWSINRHHGIEPGFQGLPAELNRSRRQFASMAAQLGLAAWMVGVLVESSCLPVVPRPTAAQVVGLTPVVSPGARIRPGVGAGVDRATPGPDALSSAS